MNQSYHIDHDLLEWQSLARMFPWCVQWPLGGIFHPDPDFAWGSGGGWVSRARVGVHCTCPLPWCIPKALRSAVGLRRKMSDKSLPLQVSAWVEVTLD